MRVVIALGGNALLRRGIPVTVARSARLEGVGARCQFVERTGRSAWIGAIEKAEAALEGTAGTVVEPA